MSEQLKLKLAPPADALEWLEKVPEFDKGIMGYPSLRMLCAYNGEPVAYLPIQRVAMLESLALREGLDDLTAAQAMRDLVKGAEIVASSDGIREICFLGTDEAMVKIAKHQGFEELPWRLLRLKL